MSEHQKQPILEQRFTQPEGWRAHQFESQGMKINFGSVFPKNGKPVAVVVCLPGLSEFTEKYYEVARTCLDMNLAFWVLDWPGQGRSERYIPKTQKRHAQDYDIEVERLNDLINGYIKNSSVQTDEGRIPLVMLGHSMGGNIGLRYLEKYPDTFECAAFSAPMFGIKALNGIPFPGLLLTMLNKIMPKSYITGGGDWHQKMRSNNSHAIFSHDKARSEIHDAWGRLDPNLTIGSPTFGWLYHAYKSCQFVKRQRFLSRVLTPCLIAIAGQETIVDNYDISYVTGHLKNAQLLEFEQSGHEIMMETDSVRDKFFKSFYQLIEKNIIERPETLKPF